MAPSNPSVIRSPSWTEFSRCSRFHATTSKAWLPDFTSRLQYTRSRYDLSFVGSFQSPTIESMSRHSAAGPEASITAARIPPIVDRSCSSPACRWKKNRLASPIAPSRTASAYSIAPWAIDPVPGSKAVVVSSVQASAALIFGIFAAIVRYAAISFGSVNRCVSSKCWNVVLAPSRWFGAAASAKAFPPPFKRSIRSCPM
jgi:hypothetical protein